MWHLQHPGAPPGPVTAPPSPPPPESCLASSLSLTLDNILGGVQLYFHFLPMFSL